MSTRYNRGRSKSKKINSSRNSKFGIKFRHIFLVQTVCCIFISGIFFFSKQLNIEPIINVHNRLKEYIKDSITLDDILEYKEKLTGVSELSGSGGLMEINEDNTEYHDLGKSGQQVAYFTHKFQNPLDNYRVTSEFGVRTHPITKKTDFHTGIDLASADNTEIKASAYGIVEETGVDDIYGNFIRVKYGDNIHAFYAHCSNIHLKIGDAVKPGDVIALVGSTGVSTGSHLHFEVEIGNHRIDPRQIMDFI